MAANTKIVKDLMVPIDQYPTVNIRATLEEAVTVLDEARRQMPEGRQPYRAILVTDDNGGVVGKIGQLAILKAVEPQYRVADDLESLRRVEDYSRYLNQAIEHSRIFPADLPALCESAGRMPVSRVMHPIAEHIDESAPIHDAVHSLVVWQTLSLLVTRGATPVGLIRLDDLCDEVTSYMRSGSANNRTDA